MPFERLEDFGQTIENIFFFLKRSTYQVDVIGHETKSIQVINLSVSIMDCLCYQFSYLLIPKICLTAQNLIEVFIEFSKPASHFKIKLVLWYLFDSCSFFSQLFKCLFGKRIYQAEGNEIC